MNWDPINSQNNHHFLQFPNWISTRKKKMMTSDIAARMQICKVKEQHIHNIEESILSTNVL